MLRLIVLSDGPVIVGGVHVNVGDGFSPASWVARPGADFSVAQQ